LASATLIGAALEVLKFDIFHVRNVFDPGEGNPDFDRRTIEQDRARWILEQLKPVNWEPLFPYVGRLGDEAAKEFFFVLSISQRLQQQKPTTYGDLRELLKTLEQRIKDLQEQLGKEAEEAQQYLATSISE
jgi:hypothetical protein